MEGSICQSKFVCQVLCGSTQGIYSQLMGGSICQSRFVCQVLCTGIQGISALFPGGPSAKVGLSAKYCVPVFKASLLYSQGVHLHKQVCLPGIAYQYSRHLFLIDGGGPSAKVGLSAKYCVVVFKASILNWWGGPSAKAGLSAKYCVLVFKASLLYSLGVHLPK